MKSSRGDSYIRHPALWATLTIAAFPIISLSLGWLGIDPLRSFAAGALATFIILLLEAAIRGRWWISEPAVSRILGDPAFGGRLLILTGTLVLLFQTMLLTIFLTGNSMDTNVVRFVLQRQCVAPGHPLFASLCSELGAGTDVRAADMAVRAAAEKRLFPGGFVTCAIRSLETNCAPRACVEQAVVHCDQWAIGTVTRIPASINQTEKTVVAALTRTDDGLYRVAGWSDDPSSAEWSVLAGTAPNLSRAADALNTYRDDLRAETFRRAMEQLRAK